MSGDKIKQEGSAEQMQSLVRFLPSYMRAMDKATLPHEQALLDARSVTDPQNAALDAQLFEQYGPIFAGIGDTISGQSANRQAQNELTTLQGPGRELALAGQALNKEIDPEYYGLRANAADKFTQLLAGQDPNALSGAEMANVERGLNRTNRVNGVAEVPTSGSAISNAMTFGDALTGKRNTLLATLNAIPQNLAAMKSGTDAFQVATGRSSSGAQGVGNSGLGQYGTGRQGFGTSTQGAASQLLGETGQNVRQNIDLTANRRTTLDQVNSTLSSLPT